jgi:hypothetical protein
MTEKTKLIFALDQIGNIASLLEGNEYQQFLYSHLVSIEIELQRQLTNLSNSSKIEE